MPVRPAPGPSAFTHRLRQRALRGWRLLWASPNSVIGLVLALAFAAVGARLRTVDGVLEVALAGRSRGGRSRLPFVAITFGHVVLGASPHDLERLRAHEHVHVRQCERWGPLFLPAYLLAGAWQWARGRRAYRDNPFEVEARRIAGC